MASENIEHTYRWLKEQGFMMRKTQEQMIEQLPYESWTWCCWHAQLRLHIDIIRHTEGANV